MKNIRQLYFKAKKSAQKLYGINAGTIHRLVGDDPDEDDALDTLAIKKAGFKRSDFFKPVRVNHLVVDDMPAEGVFDTAFCDRYKLAEDGKSWLLPAAQEEIDSTSAKVEQNASGAISTEGQDNGPEGLGYNVNGEPMADVIKKMDWPVVEMSLPMRWMAQMGRSTKTLHLNPEEYGRVMGMTAPQDDDAAPLLNNINLLLAGDLAAELDKLDLHHLHRLVMAVEKVASTDKRLGLHLLCRFVRAWLDTEETCRDWLVREWCEGRRVSRVEHVPLPEPKSAEPAKVAGRQHRSQKRTYRRLNHEIGCALYDGDLDLNNLRPAISFSKRIIAEDREDWKAWSATISCIPGILNYTSQTIVDMVRKAPAAVHNGSAALRREWCECYLSTRGQMDPDRAADVSVKTAESHKDVLAGIRKAGKRLREIESGIAIDEEIQTAQGGLADAPSATESVEQTSSEHHQNSQSLDVKASVERGTSLREKVSEQLAAGRGEFVEGISDPNDPKWVHNDYSTSNQGEKEEVGTGDAADTADSADHSEEFSNQPEPETSHSEPVAVQNEPETPKTEPVTKVADGVFDASAFFADTSNQGEKTENSPPNNERTTKQAAEIGADNEPDRSLAPETEPGSTLEILLLLRKISRNLQHIVDINQHILDSNQRILASNLKMEKAQRKDAVIKGKLTMTYATETEEGAEHGE